MSDEEKVIQALFYQTTSGREPVREWLKHELNEDQRKAIGRHLQTVEYGWPMGMPTVRKIDPGLWELRISMPGGIARVLFTVRERDMILLHGFVKKSRKAPLRELETARKRLDELT